VPLRIDTEWGVLVASRVQGITDPAAGWRYAYR
jgi:hypothetical protein